MALAVLMAQLSWTRFGVALLALCSCVASLLWIWRLLHANRLQRSELLQAELAERLAPELGSSLSSAVDFGRNRSLPSLPYSRSLAEEHIQTTALALSSIDLPSRLRGIRQRGLQRASLFLTCTIFLLVVLSIVLVSGRTRLYALLLRSNAAQIRELPIASDIRITYHYPAYTNLSPRVVEGGDGSIAALVGSEVEIVAVAEMSVRQAFLKISDDAVADADPAQPEGRAKKVAAVRDIPMQVSGGRRLEARMPILRNGNYRFSLVDSDGDRLESQHVHSISATPDAFPEISIEQPTDDVEVKDDRVIDVLWHAKDDFGITEINLVIEPGGKEAPVRVSLGLGADNGSTRREGRYHWQLNTLKLKPGQPVTFYLEALDNDAISGPKRGVSVTRRLILFSAEEQHGDVMKAQRELLDLLVDWLASDLTTGAAKPNASERQGLVDKHRVIYGRIQTISDKFKDLIALLTEDRLMTPQVITAFRNVNEHISTARDARNQALLAASTQASTDAFWQTLRAAQSDAISQLEKDIIYLDDLLALLRIDELKATAKELLASQNDLQQMLEQYRESQDPALRASLEQRIAALREKMIELLQKMGDIKKTLPGEYRNMEAASMLKLDDQLERLEKMLNEGDLDSAAMELEQLANMIENMVESIDEAEEEFGGERYAETRKEIAEFAEQFKQIEEQQKALSERANELVKDYRQKSIAKNAQNLDSFIALARSKTRQALQELDQVSNAPALLGSVERPLETTRQRLLDLDGLLAHEDLHEARRIATEAVRQATDVEQRLNQIQARRLPKASKEDSEAHAASKRLSKHSRDVEKMLEDLFPDPAEVLRPDQLAQMDRMRSKQQELQKSADELSKKVEALSKELPLFGGEPKQSLDASRQEMQQAQNEMHGGRLPGAARHKRLALEHLGKLRQSLEQASQPGKGGFPMPLGGSGQGQGENGRSGDMRSEHVEIPQNDKNRADPRFRKELLEAAKQKPPARFEDAVRKYYEELIR